MHESGAYGKMHTPEIMGSGVVLFDYDNDDDMDVYFLNGNHVMSPTPPTEEPRNRLFRQESDGRFTDVTEVSQLGDTGYGMGAAIGDIDNDGDLDVYVTNYGPNRLYLNNGDDTFTDITTDAGIEVSGWSASAAFFDYDRDGYLDLYVTQYLTYVPEDECTDRAGRLDYCGPLAFNPLPDVLFHNNGDGTFTDVSGSSGITRAFGHGLGVICADFNDDRWIDIYVANDGDANQLWINSQDGTFRDQAVIFGVSVNMHGKAEAGMGVVAADMNNDAHIDLFVTHLRNETNTLYRKLPGRPSFQDVSGSSAVGAPALPYTGFGTAALDIELDGDLDLLVVNGSVSRAVNPQRSDLGSPWNDYAEPNQLLINTGKGQFVTGKQQCGTFCSRAEITRGLGVGDLDHDGDLDAVISNTHGPARLFRNDAPHNGRWLSIRALDPSLNRDALGALVTVVSGEQRFVQVIGGNASYLSVSEFRAHFGLGSVSRVDKLEVLWPDGTREQFECPCLDCRITLERGTGQSLP